MTYNVSSGTLSLYTTTTSLTYPFSHYYFVCAIGGQHNGYLPFWLPGFVKLSILLLHLLFAIAEIKLYYHLFSIIFQD